MHTGVQFFNMIAKRRMLPTATFTEYLKTSKYREWLEKEIVVILLES